MVRGSPVSESADIYAGLVGIGYGSNSLLDFSSFCRNICDQGLSLFLFPEDRSKQSHRAAELISKYACGAGLHGNYGNTELCRKSVFLLYILIFGDNEVGLAGKDLLGLCSLRVGSAHAA